MGSVRRGAYAEVRLRNGGRWPPYRYTVVAASSGSFDRMIASLNGFRAKSASASALVMTTRSKGCFSLQIWVT